MSMLKKSMLASIGVVLLASTLTLTNVGQAVAETVKHVVVVNTTSNPVPVAAQGTTAVKGTVGLDPAANTIRAQQNGTWNVGITNSSVPVSGTVNLGNLPTDGAGNVRVAPQGTGNVNVAGGTVNVGNLPTDSSGAVRVSASTSGSGSVSVTNFPSDQLIHGTVSVSNLPAAASGVVRIDLPTQHVAAGSSAAWFNVDVSRCRSFSIFAGNMAGTPNIDAIVPGTPGFGISPDLVKKNFPGRQWAFAVQPGTTQPFYTTTLTVVFASNTAGVASDISAAVYCLQ